MRGARGIRLPGAWLVVVVVGLAVALAGCATSDESAIGLDTDRISDASRDRLEEALDGEDIDTIERGPDEGPIAAQGRLGAIGLSSADVTEHLVDLRECQDEDCVASESAAAAAEASRTLRQYMIAFDFVFREGNACQGRLAAAHEAWLDGVVDIAEQLANASVEDARARAEDELDADAQSLAGAFECI